MGGAAPVVAQAALTTILRRRPPASADRKSARNKENAMDTAVIKKRLEGQLPW